jgi:glutamyl-tRNA synthetase
VDGAVDSILGSLQWLGLDWDEGPLVGGPYGPYIQSERIAFYRQAAEDLISGQFAYKCYCTTQELTEMRERRRRNGESPGYDRRCRELDDLKRAAMENDGKPFVVRFKMPLVGETVSHDLIRGEVAFANETIDDFVILKSDGYPTYHLASVVDDHNMEISHVLRADEWLSSTPRHIRLYHALGYQEPIFAHLPIILGPDRSKLSKRHGAVSVLHYRDSGYLPEAMCNFLALLGWSLDDHTEFLELDELVKQFSIERLGKAGAIFSLEKLTWMNGVYIRQLTQEDLAGRVLRILDESLPVLVPRPLSEDYVNAIIPLVQERLKTLTDAADLMEFFFLDSLEYNNADELIQKGMDRDSTQIVLDAALQKITDIADWSVEYIESALRGLSDDLDIDVKTGQVFGTIRVAATGRKAAPPLFETMFVLGRDRCLKRLEQSRQLMQQS